MKLELRSKGVRMTRQLREHIERQVRFAASRFGERVERVRVHLTDINGPRGGEDIHCRIQAQLSPRGSVIIEETRRDPFAAVARATDRAGHSLARSFKRLKDRRRGRR